MLSEFLVSLILLVFVFRVVSAIIVLLFGLVGAFLNRFERGSHHLAVLNQVLISILLSGLIGLLCRFTVDQPQVVHKWFYLLLGFIAVFLLLGSNAAEKSKARGDDSYSRVVEGAEEGAAYGTWLGIVFFFAVYYVPSVITLLPGAAAFYEIFDVSAWLNRFWIVRLVLYCVAGSYIVGIFVVSFVTAGVALFGVFALLKRSLGMEKKVRSVGSGT
jgi:hypothetical protein